MSWMVRLLILALLGVVAVSCFSVAQAGTPEDVEAVSNMLHENFTYRRQVGDSATFHTGAEPFEGDCDDFALAAAYQLWRLGHDVELVFLGNRDGRHIIACVDGWCVDNERERPYRRNRTRRRYKILATRNVAADTGVLEQFQALAGR